MCMFVDLPKTADSIKHVEAQWRLVERGILVLSEKLDCRVASL